MHQDKSSKPSRLGFNSFGTRLSQTLPLAHGITAPGIHLFKVLRLCSAYVLLGPAQMRGFGK